MQVSSSRVRRIGLRAPLLGLILILVLTSLAACRDRTPVILTRFHAFGADVDLSLVGVSDAQAQQAAAMIAEDFRFLDPAWSLAADAPLARVNRLLKTGESFVAPPSIMPLVRASKEFAARSSGLFNPALGELMALWGFSTTGTAVPRLPDATEIARLVAAAPSMDQIHIDGLDLRGENPALALDFADLAVSQAIDLAIDHLRELGIKDALIQSRGTLRAIGDRSGQPWRVPIRRANGSGVLAILALSGDESLVTRAEYERNFLFEGQLYHAILDPRTGWPAAHSRTVTVIHPQAAPAAAAATAIFIAGPDAWEPIAAQMGVEYVLLVDAAGRLHMTPAMAERIQLVDGLDQAAITPPPQQPSLQPLTTAGAAL